MLVSRRSFVIIFAGKLGNSLNYYDFSRVRQTRSAIINKIYTHFVNLSVLAFESDTEQSFFAHPMAEPVLRNCLTPFANKPHAE